MEEEEGDKLGASVFNNLAVPTGPWPFLYFQMWGFANVQKIKKPFQQQQLTETSRHLVVLNDGAQIR